MAEKNHTCDVLVLGSGLAGLRAAIAAAEADPSLRVLVATPSDTPHGSSFANINARLGMIAPKSDKERETFAARAVALASPGSIDAGLVAVLAEESAALVGELLDLGATVDLNDNGEVMRHNSCFLREQRLAVLFTDLSVLHARLLAKAKGLGVHIRPGLAAYRIITTQQAGAHGALFSTADRNDVAICSRAVVAAMGGPAALFARTLSAPGAYGGSYGIMSQAGAKLSNAGFVQFFWCTTHDRRFFRLHRLLEPGVETSTRSGSSAPLPSALRAHAVSRATHCPLSWSMADHALDAELLARSGDDGTVTVHLPGRPPLSIAPYAHSGNGGADIDENGATTVSGLYAAGECATGMHGADRVGGAMASAAQVFGRRAGAHAASFAASSAQLPAKTFSELTKIHRRKLSHSSLTKPPALAPIPESALRTLVDSSFYQSDIIINSINTRSKPSDTGCLETALISALTVVRNLHTIA